MSCSHRSLQAALIQRQSLIAACLAPPAIFMDFLEADNVLIAQPTQSTAALHIPAVRTPRVDISTWGETTPAP